MTEQSADRRWGQTVHTTIIAGMVSLVVALFAGTTSAEFSRTASLASERRAAYSEFLGVVQTCSAITAEDHQRLALLAADFVGSASVGTTPEQLADTFLGDDCHTGLAVAEGRVSLLSSRLVGSEATTLRLAAGVHRTSILTSRFLDITRTRSPELAERVDDADLSVDIEKSREVLDEAIELFRGGARQDVTTTTFESIRNGARDLFVWMAPLVMLVLAATVAVGIWGLWTTGRQIWRSNGENTPLETSRAATETTDQD